MSVSAFLLAGASSMALGVPVPQEPIIVTASRVPQPTAEVLANVTVLTRRDIETSQARDLLGLLRLQAGVDMSRTGGPGQQTSLFLRGTDSNHTLVLIDGVRVNSVQSGAFVWEHLPLEQIERIEIVRGPHAAYYGSEALGGVIQIFTRKPEGVSASAEYGSFNTRGLNAAAGGGDGVRWHVTAGTERTDGFSAQNPDGFSFDPDNDGYENNSLSGGLTLPLGAAGTLSFTGLYTDGDVAFDQGESESEDRTLGLDWTVGEHRFQVGFDRSTLETPAFDSGFESERLSLDWQTSRALGDGGRWVVGLNYRHEDGESFSLATGTVNFDGDRDNTGVFGGVRHPLGEWEAELTLRHDENSEFGGHTTGRAAIGRDFDDLTRVWLSHGTAFRGPNLSEQFSPGFGGLFAGNPDLNPETSDSTEAAIEHYLGADQSIAFSLYHTRIDDLIAFAGEDFRAVNINESRITGLEARYERTRGQWNFGAQLTLQDTEDESTGESLLRRADEKAALTLDRRLERGGNLGLEVLYTGERRGLGKTLDAYTLVNLRARVPLTEAWTIEGRLENLLDEDYELAAGFNTPERSAFVGVSWRMD